MKPHLRAEIAHRIAERRTARKATMTDDEALDAVWFNALCGAGIHTDDFGTRERVLGGSYSAAFAFLSSWEH